jgi:hypothetical protein
VVVVVVVAVEVEEEVVPLEPDLVFLEVFFSFLPVPAYSNSRQSCEHTGFYP